MQILTIVVTTIMARMRSERGQDLIEYALLSGLIAAAIIAALVTGVLETALTSMANGIADCIDFTDVSACGP